MNPVMYIFLNKGLGMSTGKAAAQAAHAGCLVIEDFYRPSVGDGVPKLAVKPKEELYREWMDSGHYTKLTMEVEDSVMMHSIQQYLETRGYKTYLVIDEGRTENTAFKPTAMAVEIVDKDDPRTAGVFGEFKLYRDEKSKSKKKSRMPRYLLKS
jgi:peptidyl-tRNA hydrolase